MKTHQSLTLALTLAGATLVGMAPTQVNAMDIQKAEPQGIQAMKDAQWAQAQQIFQSVVDDYGPRGETLFGGRLGRIYYNKGYAELQLASQLQNKGAGATAKEWYQKAADSFEKCYQLPSDKKGKNPYHKKSIFYRGQAQQGLELYAEALESYQKFIQERSEKDKYPVGMFHINMAICHFNLPTPDLKQGISYLETAMKNKEKWKTPDGAVVSAFQALTKAVIATKNERALVDFLNQNRSVITLKPYQMVPYSQFFQKLATDALAAGMEEAAYNLFALIPDTSVALNELSALKQTLANYPKAGLRDGANLLYKVQIDAYYKSLQKKESEGDPAEVLALTALAHSYGSNGYTRAAYGAYMQLELYFNKSKRRENNLYNLVRTAAILGHIDVTQQYGQKFVDQYPEGQFAESVRGLMLTSLFASGRYEECERAAERMIEELKESSKAHEVCLYTLAGSKYYLGKPEEAQPLLEKFLQLYPESQSRLSASYFLASGYSQLQQWELAAAKLDSFLNTYPKPEENVYLAFALFDRANVHYALQQYAEALTVLNRIEAEFMGSNIEDAANNLKGNILLAQEKDTDALESYKKGLELAKKRGNKGAESEALYYIVSLLASKDSNTGDIKECLPYYEQFIAECIDSPYRAQVVVAALPAMIEANRFEEGLGHLQQVVSDLAKDENSYGLEAAIGSYTDNFLEFQKSKGLSDDDAAEKLKAEYYNFPGVDRNNARVQAMLRVSVIGVYVNNMQLAQKEKNTELAGRYEARVAATFKELKTDFPVEKLTVSGLMRVADYLRTKSSAPRQALPYYEERLKRSEEQGRADAEFGIADIYGTEGSAAERTGAINKMRELIRANPEDKDLKKKAMSRIVQIYGSAGDWDKVISEGLAYLEENSRDAVKVQQLMAEAYLQKKDFLECIKMNMALYGANTSNWKVSVPAFDTATQLMWDHGVANGGKSRQQIAYDSAALFINSSRDAFEKNKDEMPEDVRNAWKAIEARVKKWEASGAIQTLEQQEKATR